MFGAGLLGFVHEMLLPGPTERPLFLGFCGILMGLPWVLPEGVVALLLGRKASATREPPQVEPPPRDDQRGHG